MDTIVQSHLNKSKQDKFILIMSIPEILKKYNSSDLTARSRQLVNQDSLQFSIFGAVTPRISVPTLNAPYAGQGYKVSSHSRQPYDDVTVNFTIDNKFNNYWVINKWLNLLNDEKESHYNSGSSSLKLPPIDYQSTFTVYALDEFDVKTVKFTYTKAFPTSLSEIAYNYRIANDIESNFMFSFSQFFTDLV